MITDIFVPAEVDNCYQQESRILTWNKVEGSMEEMCMCSR